jgi:hypothetical protein
VIPGKADLGFRWNRDMLVEAGTEIALFARDDNGRFLKKPQKTYDDASIHS